MKLIHTGDLHIGKSLNNFNMILDQRKVLNEMVELAAIHKALAFIISGDIYDRTIPTAEAVTLMNDFLNQLVSLNIAVFIISGNHDSPERIAFAENILQKQSVYISGIYRDKLKQITLQDEYGDVEFTLMPYVKPAVLSVKTCEEAVCSMLQTIDLSDISKRRILLTHYFVTNSGTEPLLSDSESNVAIGGLDNVDCKVFDKFDYVALGHIHRPQRMDREGQKTAPIVYSGSPLPYSFSECGQEKSVTLLDIASKGEIKIDRLSLHPLHEMRKVKGKLEYLIAPQVVALADSEDYLQVTLTNEEQLIDPIGTLRSVYPNIMQLLFEKQQQSKDGEVFFSTETKHRTTSELFSDFYHTIRDKEMDGERTEIINRIIKEL